ncbi:hypothetical protein [Leucobacter celer]|nr:hypothetical protein [Leucobacter celer]
MNPANRLLRLLAALAVPLGLVLRRRARRDPELMHEDADGESG